jgi:pilus assembly protein CpaB
MKRAQIIGIAIAGSAGLLAFMAMRGILNKPQVEKTVEVHVKSTEVLVAASDIGLGQIAGEGDLRWQQWPEDAATSGYITRGATPNAVADMSGSIARSPMMAGEPITKQKLIKFGEGGVLAAILPAGMRAVSTKIKEETAAGRLIMPNDRVDVILTRRERSRSGQDEFVSDTLFRNVRVLAMGQQIETKDGKKVAAEAATATIELTASQAELMARSNSMGEISLSLRSIADSAAEGGGPMSGDALDKAKTTNAVRVLRYGVSSRAYSVN